MGLVIGKFIPILTLILLGYLIRSKQIVSEKTMVDLRKLTINYLLASLLIKTFSRMQLEEATAMIVVLMVVLYLIVFAATRFLIHIHAIKLSVAEFCTAGSAVYLVGVPLFSTLFGMEQIDDLLVMGIAQELFFWPLLVPYMKLKFTGGKFTIRNIASSLRNNIIIAIFIGLSVNLFDLMPFIDSSVLLGGLYSTIDLLATFSIPMSLIIIGYGLRLDFGELRSSICVLFLRFALLSAFGGLFYVAVIQNVIEVNEMFLYSYIAFLALPIPLALPVLVSSFGDGKTDDGAVTNNLAVLGILSNLVLTAVYILLNYY